MASLPWTHPCYRSILKRTDKYWKSVESTCQRARSSCMQTTVASNVTASTSWPAPDSPRALSCPARSMTTPTRSTLACDSRSAGQSWPCLLGSFYRNNEYLSDLGQPVHIRGGRRTGPTRAGAGQRLSSNFRFRRFIGPRRLIRWSRFPQHSGAANKTTAFLPYTINSALPRWHCRASSLDGQVDTSNYAVTVTSRTDQTDQRQDVLPHDERDNQTPVSMWSRVITDTFPTSAAEANVPYSFERDRLNLSGRSSSLTPSESQVAMIAPSFDRDYQEVAEQTEDTGWGKVAVATTAIWRPHCAAVRRDAKSMPTIPTSLAATGRTR